MKGSQRPREPLFAGLSPHPLLLPPFRTLQRSVEARACLSLLPLPCAKLQLVMRAPGLLRAATVLARSLFTCP